MNRNAIGWVLVIMLVACGIFVALLYHSNLGEVDRDGQARATSTEQQYSTSIKAVNENIATAQKSIAALRQDIDDSDSTKLDQRLTAATAQISTLTQQIVSRNTFLPRTEQLWQEIKELKQQH